MNKISDAKTVYSEFKEFKNIYTSINNGATLRIFADGDKIRLLFDKSEFSILSGRWDHTGEFGKWIIRNKIYTEVSLENFKELARTLKKNVGEIEYDETTFTFNFIDKDGSSKDVRFENKTPDLEFINKYRLLSALCSVREDLDDKLFEDSLFRVYLTDTGDIVEEKNGSKLLEIPANRILSLIKNGKKYIQYSIKNEKGFRYVSVGSSSSELGLTLEQFFQTI